MEHVTRSVSAASKQSKCKRVELEPADESEGKRPKVKWVKASPRIKQVDTPVAKEVA
jgi:hypothetical protein